MCDKAGRKGRNGVATVQHAEQRDITVCRTSPLIDGWPPGGAVQSSSSEMLIRISTRDLPRAGDGLMKDANEIWPRLELPDNSSMTQNKVWDAVMACFMMMSSLSLWTWWTPAQFVCIYIWIKTAVAFILNMLYILTPVESFWLLLDGLMQNKNHTDSVSNFC